MMAHNWNQGLCTLQQQSHLNSQLPCPAGDLVPQPRDQFCPLSIPALCTNGHLGPLDKDGAPISFIIFDQIFTRRILWSYQVLVFICQLIIFNFPWDIFEPGTFI